MFACVNPLILTCFIFSDILWGCSGVRGGREENKKA